MRIGYDLSEHAASDSGASLDVRRMLGALGDCEEIDEVVVLAAFGAFVFGRWLYKKINKKEIRKRKT